MTAHTARQLPTAEAVLETLRRRLQTSAPPGLPSAYIDGFFTRNRDTLLGVLRTRLEQLSAQTPRTGSTAWGGQRGLTILAPHQVEAGRRVVVLNSLLEWVHGTIVDTPGSSRRVQLDSGAVGWFPSLWPEVAPPTEVPRDLAVGGLDGEDLGMVSPFDLWKRIRVLVHQSLRDRRLRSGAGETAQRKAVALWRVFQPWLTAQRSRPQWLSWSGRELRLLELWSSDTPPADGTPEQLELDWLLQLPDRYQERYLPGDTVRSVSFGHEGAGQRSAREIPIERMTSSGVVYRRELYPYYHLEPVSAEPSITTCLPPFEEPARPMQVFELLRKDGSDWLETSPAQLHAWIDRYLRDHHVEAHLQLLGETGGRLRIEPIDSRFDARYLRRDLLNHVFLYLPEVRDDGIEIDLFQEEDRFDDTLPHLRRPVQIHPAFVPSLARALVTTALEQDLPLNPSIRRCLPKPDGSLGEESASGGRQGEPVIYSPVRAMDRKYVGLRVVTPEGLHGRIARSTQRRGEGLQTVEVFQVRLDSGREEPWERVHLETARPQSLVPDVRLDGRYLSPKEAWETVSLHYFRLLDQAEGRRRQPGRKALESWTLLRSRHAAWRSWRRLNPGASVSGYDANADTRIDAFLQAQLLSGSAVEGDVEPARIHAGGARPVPGLEAAPGGNHP